MDILTLSQTQRLPLGKALRDSLKASKNHGINVLEGVKTSKVIRVLKFQKKKELVWKKNSYFANLGWRRYRYAIDDTRTVGFIHRESNQNLILRSYQGRVSNGESFSIYFFPSCIFKMLIYL